MYEEDFDLETALLARLRQGDETALAELYERLSNKVYTIVFHMLQSREEAEEVLQDTFFKLFKGHDSFTTWDRSPRAFIYTVARNEAISRLRKRQARPQKADAIDLHDPDLSLPGESLSVEGDGSETTTKVWLEEALEQLPDDDRKLLEYSYFLGYSHAEIEAATQLPLGTIKSKIRRALQRLKGSLENQMADDDTHDETPSGSHANYETKQPNTKAERRNHA